MGKVCDRCGAEAYTCCHQFDEDYVLETPEEFAKGTAIMLILGLITTSVIIAGAVTLWVFLKG